MKADFLPIILGSDENAYGNARMFAEAYGVKPLLLCGKLLSACAHSRLFRMEVIDGFSRPEIFVPSLLEVLRREAQTAGKLLVIPCVDYYAAMLSEYADRFEGLIANSFPAKALLKELSEKHRFYALCRTHGLPHPKTLVICPQERVRAAELLSDFPIVLKPENSNAAEFLACDFPGKKKVWYLHSREEYRRLAAAMDAAGYRGTLVAQEYIPGGEDALCTLNTYSDANGIVRAMGLGQVLLTEHDPLMRGNSAAVITRRDAPLFEQIRTFLEQIRYVGFANFDLKTDPRSGETVVFECNPRIGRCGYYLRAAGLNFMQIFAEDVVYGRKEACAAAEKEALWRNVPMPVLKRYMQNRSLYRQAEQLAKQGRCLCTRYCREDRSILRLLQMLRYELALMRSFRKYPSDTDLP